MAEKRYTGLQLAYGTHAVLVNGNDSGMLAYRAEVVENFKRRSVSAFDFLKGGTVEDVEVLVSSITAALEGRSTKASAIIMESMAS